MSMKSSIRGVISRQGVVYRLRTAGVIDPSAEGSAGGDSGRTDLLVELGAAEEGAGATEVGHRSIRVLGAGQPDEVDAHPAAGAAAEIDMRGSVVLPGMVNAHTHLDLTHLGPADHDPDEGFVGWVDRLRAGRETEPGAIRESVERGIGLSLRAGVVLVGDIAGAAGGEPRLVPFEALADSALAGVSFLEFFAMGRREAGALARLEAVLKGACLSRGGARLGLQPHAPNTVSPAGYQRAIELAHQYGLTLSTHLAETPEEREFIADGTGPQREMLERLGVWDGSILGQVGLGRSPIEHLAAALNHAGRTGPGFVAAHVNDPGPDPDRSIELLARARVSVAYCPRASSYFGAPARFGPHRYREMLDAGITVCLGTDSILNLPRGVDSDAGPGLRVLDEARLLHARDGTDAGLLVRMMTTHGCRALGWDESACSLSPGARPLGLVAVGVQETLAMVGPAERLMRSSARASLLTRAGRGH